MSEYRKGEHVRVTLEGAVAGHVLGSLYIVTGDGDGIEIEIPDGAPGVTIERVAPVGWPPRPGDLWRTERQPYFVVDFGDRVAMTNRAGEHFTPDFILAHGPLRLVHREDEQDGGRSDG